MVTDHTDIFALSATEQGDLYVCNTQCDRICLNIESWQKKKIPGKNLKNLIRFCLLLCESGKVTGTFYHPLCNNTHSCSRMGICLQLARISACWGRRVLTPFTLQSKKNNKKKQFGPRSVITMLVQLSVLAPVHSSGAFFYLNFFLAKKGVLMLLKSKSVETLLKRYMWATRPRGHSKNVISLAEHISCTCAPDELPGRKDACRKKKRKEEAIRRFPRNTLQCGFGCCFLSPPLRNDPFPPSSPALQSRKPSKTMRSCKLYRWAPLRPCSSEILALRSAGPW